MANISRKPILPIEEHNASLFISSISLLKFASNLQLVSLTTYETYSIPPFL